MFGPVYGMLCVRTRRGKVYATVACYSEVTRSVPTEMARLLPRSVPQGTCFPSFMETFASGLARRRQSQLSSGVSQWTT